MGEERDQRAILGRLVELQYERNDIAFARNKFRVRGDTIEVFPAYEERAVRIQLFGDEVERIASVDPLTGEVVEEVERLVLFPASHYATDDDHIRAAIEGIEAELAERLAWLEKHEKLLEAQRLRMRTTYDLEMMREIGVCSGIENYSRHLDGRSPGQRPFTLLDYFPDDFLCVVDESHVTVPQLHGQFEGDRSRKETLVEHGFRLPSAMDNRPLRFEEFTEAVNQVVFLSATPSSYEIGVSTQVAEQIVRPTGLIDPEVVVRPTRGQIDDLVGEIRTRTDRDQRILVTTLTKKMAEDLTDYLIELGLRVRYLHSEVDTLERVEILRGLRLGDFDVLVGINLLREGLDLPEVSLVSILDADKEGFLRSETSLIQMIGRAARNVDGQVIMYADQMTDSMRKAISETNRRRKKQLEYNAEHGIDPQTVRKKVTDILEMLRGADGESSSRGRGRRGRGGRDHSQRSAVFDLSDVPPDDLGRLIQTLQDEMADAARDLRFEEAARLRDEIQELKRELRAAVWDRRDQRTRGPLKVARETVDPDMCESRPERRRPRRPHACRSPTWCSDSASPCSWSGCSSRCTDRPRCCRDRDRSISTSTGSRGIGSSTGDSLYDAAASRAEAERLIGPSIRDSFRDPFTSYIGSARRGPGPHSVHAPAPSTTPSRCSACSAPWPWWGHSRSSPEPSRPGPRLAGLTIAARGPLRSASPRSGPSASGRPTRSRQCWASRSGSGRRSAAMAVGGRAESGVAAALKLSPVLVLVYLRAAGQVARHTRVGRGSMLAVSSAVSARLVRSARRPPWSGSSRCLPDVSAATLYTGNQSVVAWLAAGAHRIRRPVGEDPHGPDPLSSGS